VDLIASYLSSLRGLRKPLIKLKNLSKRGIKLPS